MIKDPVALGDARKGWAAVRGWQEKTVKNLTFAFAGGGILGQAITELPYNLAFVFAYGVLHDVLGQLRDEGVFPCKRRELGALMAASQFVLPWADYAQIDKGRDARNKLAHDAVVVPRGDTFTFVDAIEAELLAWQILTAPVPWK